MGKDNDESAEQPDSDSKNSSEEKKITQDVDEEETNETEVEKEETKETKEPKEPEGKKEDTENIRKVIKFDDNKSNEKSEKKETELEKEPSDRGELEQKRAILQSIKDFDFQIKKNQEEITGVNKKLESVSKDLDDLVSLYEIVSEQMNPFVGLSKVTKKRIDALENFTKEIDDLKNRIGEIESFTERAGADFKNISSEKTNVQGKKETPREETPKINTIDKTREIENKEFNGDDIDLILEKSLAALSYDTKIDNTIDNFIENLKTNNLN